MEKTLTALEIERLRGILIGLKMASDQVRSHWNDSSTMTNQKDQAERSANVLDMIAHDKKIEILKMFGIEL